MTAKPQSTNMTSAVRAAAVILPLIVTAIAYRTSASHGFLGDAQFLLQHNAHLHDVSTAWDQLTHDYFWSSSGNTIPYWRPWTKLSWLFETLLLGGSAPAYHAVQVSWHLVATLAAMALASLLGARLAGVTCCGLLVGLSPAAIEPVCLLMARSDVVAAAASLLTIYTWQRWRGERSVWLGFHALTAVLALGSKETSVVLAPTLTIWALADWRWRQLPLGTALKRVAPIVCLSALALLLRKLVLLGRPSPTIEFDLLRIFGGGGRYLLALLPLQFETGLRNVSYAEVTGAPSMLAATCVAWLTVAGAVAWAIRKRDAQMLGLLAWIGGTLAPVLLVQQMNVPNVEGKFPLADRWVLQAAVGASVLLTARWPHHPRRFWHVAAVGAVCGWALLSLVASAAVRAPYHSELTLLDKEDLDFAATPEAFRSEEDQCRHRDRAIVRSVARGEHHAVLQLTAASSCPFDLLRSFNRLSALRALGRWRDAAELADFLLSQPSADTRHLAMLYHIRGQAALHQQRANDAIRWLHKARKAGLRNCGLLRDLALASRAAGEAKAAQGYLAEAQRCLRQ